MLSKNSTHFVALGALVGLFVGLVAAYTVSVLLGPQKPAQSVTVPPLRQGDTLAQAEAHFDFGHTRRLAVPCWPGYRCSEWDGLKLKDGRHSYAVIFVEPEARQSVRPPIRRPDNE